MNLKQSIEKLNGTVPAAVLDQLPGVAEKFKIDSNRKLAHFLAQCAHESGNFKITEENLNYSASRLKAVFGKYFMGNLNMSYANKPTMIANRVYANRMGNGYEASGDGWKYRGRGYIQLTGKENYANFTAFIGADCVSSPDWVATKFPLVSAAYYFTNRRIWVVCEEGIGTDVIRKVTRLVNGGEIGLDSRIEYFKKFITLLDE